MWGIWGKKTVMIVGNLNLWVIISMMDVNRHYRWKMGSYL